MCLLAIIIILNLTKCTMFYKKKKKIAYGCLK